MENQVKLIAGRIKELRQITNKTPEQMAAVTNMTVEDYLKSEEGENDFSFTFVHNCAKVFGVDITEIITGENAKLQSFTIVRKDEGVQLERRKGFKYTHLAPTFKGRMSEPFLVRAKYDETTSQNPIALATHDGEEFDYILSGTLKINIAGHESVLNPGDAVYYDSATPHGMVAVGGGDCEFIAVVIDEPNRAYEYHSNFLPENEQKTLNKKYGEFIECVEETNGSLVDIKFVNTERFNFAYDVVDKIAQKSPDKLAMLHLDSNKNVKRFTFGDMSRMSNQVANYFTSLGIKKGDRVMLVLKLHWQFWPTILAISKIGAIVVPATHMLMKKDFEYRFNSAGVKAVVCTADGDVAHQLELSLDESPTLKIKMIANGMREGWHSFDEEFPKCSDVYKRPADCAAGNDNMLMMFTSGTTGYPRIAKHSHTYPLAHFITAKYWHNVDPNGIHYTMSDTGWGKSLWGMLYGQWLCEGAIFAYDYKKFEAPDILPLFKQHNITSFCAPPTIYRFFIKEDLSKYDLSTLQYVNTAGEALNPEVFHQFEKATGLKIFEGFGQTETTLTVANLKNSKIKLGSMGLPSPMYDMDILDSDGNPCKTGETGEIVVYTNRGKNCGVFLGYYSDTTDDHINKEATEAVWQNGVYHTGDTAWRDEEGYYWYVGRTDDLIKSSGYRIGPFEIESVIMELPYVLECAVTAVPDEVRGQAVKATIVLTKGTVGTEELKKEIQDYVKNNTAPYKYPRVVEFINELPKTISGKIRRVELRKKDK
ncbi:MAG: AMP-binding protein [Oscillospiraceae bacterium]|nr:AMP-binding protein [Oscillospiraceae bacterium]